MKEIKDQKCRLCSEKVGDEYGHNPYPLAAWRALGDPNVPACCNACNSNKVIPARLVASFRPQIKR